MARNISPAAGDGLHRYMLAIGSNRPLSRRLSPLAILRAAIMTLAEDGHRVHAVSPIIHTAPIGPSRRRYANGALMVASPLPPNAMLAALQTIERRFGRRRARRWGARTLDIDIILWSGGGWSTRALAIPHPAWRDRAFVLTPLTAIATGWRDPTTGLGSQHLLHRLKKSRPFNVASG